MLHSRDLRVETTEQPLVQLEVLSCEFLAQRIGGRWSAPAPETPEGAGYGEGAFIWGTTKARWRSALRRSTPVAISGSGGAPPLPRPRSEAQELDQALDGIGDGVLVD